MSTTYPLERMNALTEGVYAIVLTLLVLELRLPEANESILVLMREDAAIFLAWLISFILIGRFWIVHHSIVARLQECRTATLVLNLAVLGAVSLVPFSSDLLGTQRITEPWSTVVFAVNVALLAISVGLLARHALRDPSLHRTGDARTVLAWHRTWNLVVLPTAALAAAALAFAHPYLAVIILPLELVAFLVLGRRVEAATAGAAA